MRSKQTPSPHFRSRRDRGTPWAELLRLLVCERRAGVSGLRANARRGLGGCDRVGGVDEDCRTAPANRASAVAEPRRRRAVSRPSLALQACKQQPNGTPSDCRSPARAAVIRRAGLSVRVLVPDTTGHADPGSDAADRGRHRLSRRARLLDAWTGSVGSVSPSTS